MEGCKSFRVDWFPRDAFIDFSELKAEETGVLMQIINLIYSHNRAIDNDPKYIGKVCNITCSKCARIIENLIKEGHIYLNEEGKIQKKRCEKALKEIEERRKKYSENGRKGSAARWKNEENQSDENSQTISSALASTSSYTNLKTDISTHTSYDVEIFLQDSDRRAFRSNCPGEDIYYYIREFNAEINEGKRSPPSKWAAKAFLTWSDRYFYNHSIQ